MALAILFQFLGLTILLNLKDLFQINNWRGLLRVNVDVGRIVRDLENSNEGMELGERRGR